MKSSLLSMPPAMLALVAGLAASCGGSDSQAEGPTRGEGDEDVIALLKPIREKYRLPAVSLAILRSDGIRKVGVVGVRKAGTDVQATLADSWHLGSDTKAMTATLLGVLVDQGRLAWTTTMAESFPEMSDAMDPVFRKVTLAHVLSHRAGLPANVDYDAYLGLATVQTQRLALAKAVLAAQPLSQPGSTYLYSNVGYIVAGTVAERIAGMDWESALQQYVTSPLGMSSVGFGGLGTPGQIDQPWGHLEPGKPVLANGPDMDNPPVVAPAGRVHSTIQDWALFIGDQLRGVRGQAGVLSTDGYQALVTPPFGGDYALGWGVPDRAWAGGKALTHSGSNTMNFATVWIAPAKDLAILVCTNLGDAAEPVDQVVTAAITTLVPTLAP